MVKRRKIGDDIMMDDLFAPCSFASRIDREGGPHPKLVAILVLVIALGMTLGLWWDARQDAARELQANFDSRVRETIARIEQRMMAYEQVLYAARGLFEASDSVERVEFSIFAGALHLGQHYPGIQGLGYSLVVPPEQRDRHTGAIRKEGFPEYEIRPSGVRETYTSIIYLEPFSGRNLRAFGYDMYSESVRRAAMEQARDQNQIAISGKVTLVQETKTQIQAGFLMYLPIYKNSLPHETVAERRANLLGWVYSPFRMNDLMGGLGGEHAAELDIEIYDGHTVLDTAMLYDGHSGVLGNTHRTTQTQIEMAGHPWTIVVHSLPDFDARINKGKEKFIVIAGGLFSLMLAFLAWLLATSRARAIHAAEKMNHELIESRNNLELAMDEQRALLDNAMVGIALLIDRRFIWTNRKMDDLFGYAATEMYGLSSEIIYPSHEEFDALGKEAYSAIARGESYIGERLLRRKNGELFWSQMNGKAIDPANLDKGTFWILQDISLRRQAEDALRNSEQQFRHFFEKNGSVMLLIDPESGEIVAANPAASTYYGYPLPQLLGMPITKINILSSEEVTRERKLALHEERNYFNFPHRLASGEIRDVEVYSTPVEVSGSGLLFSIVHDITQRKQAETALHQSEENFRKLSQRLSEVIWGTNIGTWEWNIQTGETQFNERWAAMLGYTLKELAPISIDTWLKLAHPEDIKLSEEKLERHFSHEAETYECESRMRHKNGMWIWVLDRGRVVEWTEENKPWRMSGTHQDITARKQVEEQLRQERDFSDGVLDTARCLIMVIDRAGNIVRINSEALEFTGYGVDEIKDQPFFWSRFLLPEQREKVQEVFAKLIEGNIVPRYENFWVRRNGSTRLFDWSNSLLRGADGRVEYLVTVGIDITDRKQAEDELRQFNARLDQLVQKEVAKNRQQESMLIQQSRLAAMGEMIGNIAHQWRQPLNALGLLIANIKDAYDYDELNAETLEESVDKGMQYIEKMSTTIDDFRNFFKPNKLKTDFRLEQPTMEALKLVSQSLKNHNIDVRVECDPDAQANGFPNEFSQVVLNILNNAKDAMLERNISNGLIKITICHDADQAWVTLQDNAGGVPEDILSKIFDPYFTTKAKGTGIGLYMSKMIMEHMNGSIEVRNVDGGAKFNMVFQKDIALTEKPTQSLGRIGD